MSHETIYRTLFIQARGALKKELLQHLRRSRRMRRSRHHTQKTADHGQITDTVSIRERPAEAEDRAVPGHWEGDLIAGFADSYIATLVERQSRFTMLVKVNGKGQMTGYRTNYAHSVRSRFPPAMGGAMQGGTIWLRYTRQNLKLFVRGETRLMR